MGSPASSGSSVTVKRKRVAYLALATAGLLVLGLVYAWSIFATPIAVQYGWDKGSLQLVFNIAMICFCVAALLGSYAMKVLPLKGALAIAATMIALGFLGTAFFASKSLVGMYFSYGLLCGAGCGMGYNLVISAVNSWFPDKIGFSSGVMMMGMGLGSLLLGSAADSLIGIVGIELGFIVLAVVAFAVVIALSTVLKPAPADAASLLARSSSGPHASNDGLCDRAPLKDPLFYVYMIWAIFTIAVGITLIGGVKQGALVLGVDGAFATLVVGLCSTMNGVSRLAIGALYDKFGLLVSIFTSGLLITISAIAITFSYASSIAVVYIAASLCVGFGYGSIPVIASAFAKECYGAKDYARNFATINMAAAIGSFLSIGLISMASPDGTSSNATVWMVFAVLAIVGLVDAVCFARMYRKRLNSSPCSGR